MVNSMTTKEKLRKYGMLANDKLISQIDQTQWPEVLHYAYPNQKRKTLSLLFEAGLNVLIIGILILLQIYVFLFKQISFLESIGASFIFLLFTTMVVIHFIASNSDNNEMSYNDFYQNMFFNPVNMLIYSELPEKIENKEQEFKVATKLMLNNKMFSDFVNDQNHVLPELIYRIYYYLEFIDMSELTKTLIKQDPEKILIQYEPNIKWLLFSKEKQYVHQAMVDKYLKMLNIMKDNKTKMEKVSFRDLNLSRKEFQNLDDDLQYNEIAREINQIIETIKNA